MSGRDKMSCVFIGTLLFYMIEGSLFEKHVANSLAPVSAMENNYNIATWVKELHLQECVIVEIGENYCALFVESRPKNHKIVEYFLGLCDLDTLQKWNFCSTYLQKQRKNDCSFRAPSGTRVHRRLCDISKIAYTQSGCNCSATLANRKLLSVIGFPTCFIPPLPQSICLPRNVCGISKCNTYTVLNRVHSVQCDLNCYGQQPFCEYPNHQSTKRREITSFWSDWSQPFSDRRKLSDFIYSEAICLDKKTGKGAIDCLGPGTNCCPSQAENCTCKLSIVQGVLKLFRTYREKKVQEDRSTYSIDIINLNNDNVLPKKSWLKDLEYRKGNWWYKHRLIQRSVEREEDDDDDDDDDYYNDDDDENEDVKMEEVEHDTKVSTTESLEKDELHQRMHIPESKTVTDLGEESDIDKIFTDKNVSRRSININGKQKLIICFLLILCFIT